MIIQFSPWGYWVGRVSERTWTSGDASFSADGKPEDTYHDGRPDLQEYKPQGVLLVQDEEYNEFLVEHMRAVEVEDVASYSDGQELEVAPWPDYWATKCLHARQLADALTAFDEMLDTAPTDYFDSHALKVLDIFARERMENEFTQLRKDIAAWRETDEAKALDKVVDDGDEET